MKVLRVDFTSDADRMKIFDVVTGSNQRLIQPQTVGKKTGAPIICGFVMLVRFYAFNCIAENNNSFFFISPSFRRKVLAAFVYPYVRMSVLR